MVLEPRHTFRVESHQARLLVLSTPAGIDRYVRLGGTPAEHRTIPPRTARDDQRIAAAAQACGVQILGSPPAPNAQVREPLLRQPAN